MSEEVEMLSPRTCSGLAYSGRHEQHGGGRLVLGPDEAGVEQFGDAEVDEFGLAAVGDEDVAGLEVAVDDEVLVREVDRVADLAEEFDALGMVRRWSSQ